MLKRIVLGAVLACGLASPAAAQRTPPALADRDLFDGAARTAWAYVNANYNERTGWVNSVTGYHYATVWDLASSLMALYCADQLDLLEGDEYDRRMRRALQSLVEARLFENVAFNKMYSTTTGAIAGRPGQEAETEERGYGWSVLDMGRMMMVLRVIHENQPQYRDLIAQVVGRLNFERMIQDGYLRGEDLDSRGRLRRYQEGRIGYEQYAATGFAAWGHVAPQALDVRQHGRPATVLGIPLLTDTRGDHHLTSEPFVMIGLEVGWSGEMRELAWRVLAAQEARYRQTGTVTIVNEDAVNGPPYFLYYSVYSDGREFVVEPPAGAPEGPASRTVSVKGAFGWHALLPSAYTWLAVQRVEGARSRTGWGAGVFEESGRVSGGENVNTAAVILEAALYVARGRPLMDAGPSQQAAPTAGQTTASAPVQTQAGPAGQ
ncbi:DUF3131 domain-containing protein [Longimicrobium sp.]|uniref:DUF3131 domain-containing protein n=1 Tax=Longimicrobium sp. TaxID=2029185 RepID=UPI002E379376|nr:DUF3131 domain-containing protein [Longimicrobium sp.]HEX6036413.1 DUF3131 domain-containing protein [Longimicrobium sp.]